MSLNRYLSHGIVAAAAWTAGGFVGYGFAQRQRGGIDTNPATVSIPVTAPVRSAPASKPVAPVIATVAKKTSVETGAQPANSVASRETFRMNARHGVPVVLVRAVEAGSAWSVQNRSEPAEDSFFACTAAFGDSATAPGTPFEMTTLFAMTPEEIQKFSPGTTLHELPSNKLTSPVIQVVRR